MTSDQAKAGAAVIAGVGECGVRADAELLVSFASAASSSVAAAAVRAVAALDRNAQFSWFMNLVMAPRSWVAKEAARAIVAAGNAAPVGRLRAIVRDGPPAHSRRFALRVLLRRHPYDAVADAIGVSASSDSALARAACAFIERTSTCRVPYGPNDAQRAAVLAAMANCEPSLPDDLLKKVRDLMGIAAS